MSTSQLRSSLPVPSDPSAAKSSIFRAGTRSLGFRRSRLQVDAALSNINNRQPEVQHMAQQLLSSVHASLTSRASGFLRSVACRVNINLSSYPLLNSMLPAEVIAPTASRPDDPLQHDTMPTLALPGLDHTQPTGINPSAIDDAASSPTPLLQNFLSRAERVEVLYACLLSDLSNMAYDVFRVEDEHLLRHNLTLVSSSSLPLYGPVRQEAASAGSKPVTQTSADAPEAATACEGRTLPIVSSGAAAELEQAKAAVMRSTASARPLRQRSPQRRAGGQQLSPAASATCSSGGGGGSGRQAAATSPPRSRPGAAAASRSPSRSHMLSLPSPSRQHVMSSASVNHALPIAAGGAVCLEVASPTLNGDRAVAATVAVTASGPFNLLRGWGKRTSQEAVKSNATTSQAVSQTDLGLLPKPVAEAVSKTVANEQAAAAAGQVLAPETVRQSVPPPPAAWFAADDPATKTRYLVIQGSTTLEHWAINLKFEPVPFEDPNLGVRVHRGMYEAAAQLYDELLPLVRQHLASSPDARVALGGHSLGGSVASVLMLLLVMRDGIDPARLAPSYSFGAPAVFCAAGAGSGSTSPGQPATCGPPSAQTASSGASSGAATGLGAGALGSPRRSLMARLGIPETLLTNVVMHKDIVPRAFLCNYTIVADFLKRFMPSFKDHATLAASHDHKYLYTYIGTVSVLRPDDDAPFVDNDAEHPYLPSEAGLYKLRDPHFPAPALPLHGLPSTLVARVGRPPAPPAPTPAVLPSLRAALLAFMDYPHPLQSLSSLSSYGSDGAISRWHNPANYHRGLSRLL